MRKSFVFIVFLGYTIAGCRIVSTKSKVQNCFSPANFEQVKKYIEYRILHSGMGTKFYLEFPPNSTSSGRKQLPQNTEKIYDIRFEENLKQIVFTNIHTKIEHNFHATQGLISKKDYTENDLTVAHAIFCHLLQLALENER
ncbi:MAG: hypothetical protein NZ551_06295 [Microscillaceae bacterium]|nr:hypothetical protein [Microscillaceae bacterium]MDW8460804.1 hypothetical protein [Cytophagales bacterium]